MKKLTFIFVCLFSCSLFGQVEQSSSVNYINVSGDNAYTLDTLTYSDGSLRITRGLTLDSTALMALIAADTVQTNTLISSYTANFNSKKNQMDAIQTLKTQDSLRMVYWTQRIAQLRIVKDSIIAN
jgi:hypothetical protein